ncbi:MAG TPA: hypothetical protein VLG16_02130 [Candidatus Saccharimonadales bacterium]|nr:hypothetical protein [Candidatus Saccharimonadales bacterium]
MYAPRFAGNQTFDDGFDFDVEEIHQLLAGEASELSSDKDLR